MKVDDFPYCCGADIIYDLPDPDIRTVKKEDVRRAEEEFSVLVNKKRFEVSVLFLVLNTKQNKLFKDYLIKTGWKSAFSRIKNINSELSLYGYILNLRTKSHKGKKLNERKF